MLPCIQMSCEIIEYVDVNSTSPFADWFNDLDAVTAARVDKHVRRMEHGNFGNSRHVGSGVLELKIDIGPGYRIYYGKAGDTLVILLGGGDKKRQSYDIAKAIQRWTAYKKGRK